MAEFDFKELTARAHFDYIGPSFPLWWKNNKNLLVLPDLLNLSSGLQKGGKYFSRLTLGYEGEEFKLPNEPLLQLGLSKTIVETPTVGKYRKGTVKEYINTEDWQVTIRGVCVDAENKDRYPAEQVDTLNKLFEINEAVDVVSNKFLAFFGIEKLVLKEIELEEMAGQQSLQKYKIQAVSDQGFFADLLEKEELP